MVQISLKSPNRTDLTIRKVLLLAQVLIFALPFLIFSYILHKSDFKLDISHLLMIAFIFLLVLSGMIILRKVADRFLILADHLKRSKEGYIDFTDIQQDVVELRDISHSFNQLMEKFQQTTHELDQRVLELVTLRELTEVVRRVVDMDELLNILLDKSMALTGSQIGSVFKVDAPTRTFRVTVSRGLEHPVEIDTCIPIESSVVRPVIEENRTLLVHNIEEDARTQRPNNPMYGTPSFLSMPIYVRDRVAAVMNLSHKETGRIYESHDERLLTILLSEIKFALENAQLYTEIRDRLREIKEYSLKLEEEIDKRKKIEEELKDYRDHLEDLVGDRARELSETNILLEREIVERRQAEMMLREREETLRTIINSAKDMIFIKDRDLRFTLVNASLERFIGAPSAAIVGRTDLDLMGDVQGACFAEGDLRVLQGNVVEYETDVLSANASHTFHFVKVPIRDTLGTVINVCGIARDYTERKKLEMQYLQAQKLEAVGTLAGGIAHDFNNLLMSIQGNTSLILLDLDSQHPHYAKLRSIEEQIHSGAGLTKQLLGFARGGQYDIRPLNMNEIIDKSAGMFGRTKKDVTIHNAFDENLWSVEADRGQIEQVLLNLYVNAWQAMPSGGNLYLESANAVLEESETMPHSLPPGRYVRITVRDTGMGMDDKTRERIFEPFFTTKEMGRGTGLGLASVYGIIQAHKGFIEVHSQKGYGTTFTIYLPASDKKFVQETMEPEALLKGQETILIVDDEEIVLYVSQELLKSLGYQVLTARNGEEAIRIFRTSGKVIDLVILDMIMPGMNGAETFEGLREMNPDVRVILSSGYSLDDQAKDLLNKGCGSYIQKPFKLQILSEKVREALDNPEA